jgi:hypothetical protein
VQRELAANNEVENEIQIPQIIFLNYKIKRNSEGNEVHFINKIIGIGV